MSEFGLLLVVLGAIGNYVFNKMYKKGKITTTEQLVKYKMLALAMTIVGVILTICFY